MSDSGFRWQRGSRHEDLAELVGYGVLKADLVLTPPERLAAPLAVRPEAGDVEEDWVGAIESVLGDRIATTADNPAVAGALGVEIAVRLGALGRRVVLIDGSVERPVLAKALPDDGDEGLVDIVAFGVSAAKAVRRTLATGVTQITAGSYPLSASEIFESDAFAELVATLAKGATVVLILPVGHLRPASASLRTVVAVAKDTEGIRDLAVEAPGRDVIGVLAASAPEGALGPRGAAGAASAAVDGAGTTPEPAEPPSAERPTVEPAEESAPEAPAGEPRRREPSWAVRQPGTVVTAARSARLERRRPRRTLSISLVVIAVAIVGGWFGIRSLRPGQDRPTETAERNVPASVREHGREGEPARASGEAEVPGEAARQEAIEGAPRGAVEEASPEAAPAGEVKPASGEIEGPGGPYTLFVTSHRIVTEARAQVELLARVGVSATVVTTEVGETGVWHRVAVSGGYPTLAAAREALAQVRGLGYDGAWIEKSQETR